VRYTSGLEPTGGGSRRKGERAKEKACPPKGASLSNTYEASGVKRADGCIAGVGWLSAKQTVSRRSQARAADLISVAGHSLSCTKHLLRIDVSRETWPTGNSSTRKCYVLETLLYPHAGLLNVAGCGVRHSQLVSDSGEGQPRDTWGRITKKMSGRDGPINACGSGSVVQMFPHSPCCIDKEGTA
jgi:hypothetical protein